MKALLLVAVTLALAVSSAHAGVSVSINLGGGGFHGGYFSGGGGRCGYTANCFRPYRSCAYFGYPAYSYPGYGYSYGAYSPYYYSGDDDVASYYPTYALPPAPAPAPISEPAPAPAPQTQAVTPAPVAPPAPAPAPMEFGILDVNGYVHSPYSDALLKIPGVRNAQMVYDPVTGKPFLVR